MPAPTNVSEFIDVVRRSGLVAEDRLQAELDFLKSSSSPPQNIDQLAGAFLRDGLLTRFQAKQMKLGRYKRFEIAGKYRLLELLGIGGMGAVYLCEHTFMKRLVALKVLPVEKLEDPSALGRFYREARAVAAMDHPNIVRAYDIDKYEQIHFLVMEYVDGTSIQEVVAKHGPIDPLRAANYIAQSAHGLHHAQELGLVHRDIKPGNLLLERTGIIKILDMGLARFFDQKSDNLTEKFDNNCVLGTADYLAPEQAVSNVVDIRADIYALGGTMYFMLTGQSPFPDGTIASKLMAHQSIDPKPVTDFRRDVENDLLAVLHKMMRKNPDERYQSPLELADALQPWANIDIELPPSHEMPDLCPAVLALTGHALDKSGKVSGSSRYPSLGSSSGIYLGAGSSVNFPKTGMSSSGSNRRQSQAEVPTSPMNTNPDTTPNRKPGNKTVLTAKRAESSNSPQPNSAITSKASLLPAAIGAGAMLLVVGLAVLAWKLFL